MKRYMLFFLMVAFVLASSQARSGDGAARKFERIKSLVGQWQGKGEGGMAEGKTISVSYELISDGSAVLERMNVGEEHNMVTIYHLDGDKLMFTHYCAQNNQPRMRAEPGGNDDMIRFSLIDVTNLAEPTDGHMQKMVMTFKGKDQVAHDWTFVQNGKESEVPFQLKRVKSST